MSHSPGFLARVAVAKSKIKETSVEAVAARIKSGESLILVDTREDEEWKAGHIPGAVHIGKGVIERDIEQQMPNKSAEIILYCGGGFRSAIAAESLQQMGYTNVLSMDGGYRTWKEKGLPTVLP
ncbi:MAG: hypothetical protein KGQ59_10505 [Bdellovibrionales bacterium]|nr:hypothetical protein [Bdellovibrionales bacterium]